MKFRFRLDRLLRRRKLEEQMALKSLQESQKILEGSQQVLHALQQRTHEAHGERVTKQQGGAEATMLGYYDQFINGQKVRIADQEVKVQDHQQTVDDQFAVVREKAKEYKALEKLKDKSKAKFMLEKKKKEQKEVDEIITMGKFGGLRR